MIASLFRPERPESRPSWVGLVTNAGADRLVQIRPAAGAEAPAIGATHRPGRCTQDQLLADQVGEIQLPGLRVVRAERLVHRFIVSGPGQVTPGRHHDGEQFEIHRKCQRFDTSPALRRYHRPYPSAEEDLTRCTDRSLQVNSHRFQQPEVGGLPRRVVHRNGRVQRRCSAAVQLHEVKPEHRRQNYRKRALGVNRARAPAPVPPGICIRPGRGASCHSPSANRSEVAKKKVISAAAFSSESDAWMAFRSFDSA
jgi:hypothetical protein